jgi:hypothetical protein
VPIFVEELTKTVLESGRLHETGEREAPAGPPSAGSVPMNGWRLCPPYMRRCCTTRPRSASRPGCYTGTAIQRYGSPVQVSPLTPTYPF